MAYPEGPGFLVFSLLGTPLSAFVVKFLSSIYPVF
jgi:hypothetical protein